MRRRADPEGRNFTGSRLKSFAKDRKLEGCWHYLQCKVPTCHSSVGVGILTIVTQIFLLLKVAILLKF